MDLPTFGRPTIAMRGRVSGAASSSTSSRSGKSAVINSARSPTPSPCAAEIASGSPSASSWNSALTVAGCMPSALLTTSQILRPVRRSCSAIARSCAVSPWRPSTSNTTASASSMASSVCCAMTCITPSCDYRLEPARVHDDVRLVADASAPVMPVARQAGNIGDDRIAAARQPVEKRRLADVRTADDNEGWNHCAAARNKDRDRQLAARLTAVIAALTEWRSRIPRP